MPKRLSERRYEDDEVVSVLDSQPSSSKRKKSEEVDFISRSVRCSEIIETAGKVKHIHLKNFMCHASMDIALNPMVNFIVGRNGSGKSAVLAALTIGLGGKAITTSRGSSLKDFIKDGTHTTTIEITLINKGPNEFKPQIYGNQITVTRTISKATGASSYRLKTGYGEVKRIKKEELDCIVRAFNIQIDNPICVLNQDTARKFLNSSDPEEKFMEFMKATSMLYIRNSYENALNNKRTANVLLLRKLKHLELMAHEVRQWEHKWKLSQSIETYRERKRHLENELYWAVACQLEREFEKLKEEVEQQQSLCPKLLAEVEKEKNEVIIIKNNLSELEEELGALQKQFSEAEANFKRSKEDVRIKREKCAVTNKNIQTLNKEITRTQNEVHTLESELQRITSMSQPEFLEKKAELKKKIQEMEQREEELQAVLKMRNSHCAKLKGESQKTMAEAQTLVKELQELNINIEQKKQEIAGMKRGSSNSMAVFGSKIPLVLQKIDETYQQGKFCRKPIGPLGAFIKLKDASWAPAVESVIRGTLQCFCVHNQQDLQQLNKIFLEVYGNEKKPQVVTSRFLNKVHDVSNHAVKCQKYSNMLDMLIVDNPVVTNCIIDQLEVETILLIPTSEEAYQIMSNAANVPRNCKRAITKQSHIFFPDPNYKSYAGDGNQTAKFLQVSMQEAIKVAELALQKLQQQKTVVDQSLRAVKKRNETIQSEVSQMNVEIAKLKSDGYILNSKLMKLRDSEEPDTSSVATLTEEFDQYKQLLESRTAECAELQAELKDYVLEQEAAEEKCEKLRNVVASIQRKEQPILLQKKKLQNELQIIESRTEKQQRKYSDQCERLHHLQQNLQKMKEQVKKAIDDANIVCPRIPTERSSEMVQKELEDCKTYIESVEKESGTPQEISKMYLEKKKKHDSIEMEASTLNQTLEMMDKLVKERQRKYLWTLRLVISRVQHAFQFLLHRRNFKGDVIIDIAKKTLHLEASSSSGDVQISDPMNLSGGERSYFTVALIMALWDCVEPPFYVLDEFDVFMDKVNRRVVMDLLLAHAQEAKHHQFIFLTPQDTSNISSNSDISILRMEDPRKSSSSQNS